LPESTGTAVAIAQHRSPDPLGLGLASLLQAATPLPVEEATDKEPIRGGHVYLAPADYHLLVEPGQFTLSVDARVNFARPSIDVLFESAADAYGAAVIGVLLTGANEDGAAGLARIEERGGFALVEDPDTAQRREMPAAGLAATAGATVLPVERIGSFLGGLCAGDSVGAA
jgi:two-component system chemotaxis response regulator CheB